MSTQQMRRPRQATLERWAKAAERAIKEHIEVRQVNSSGAQANVAYLMEITNGIVRSCSCPAGEFGDSCCKHAARFYLDAGLLDPEPPTPAAPPPCVWCDGKGYLTDPDGRQAPIRCDCVAGRRTLRPAA
jgi:hypothetical protein